MTIHPIAHFHSPFSSKFGIPKQSGIIDTIPGQIVFVQEWRNADALRGIEGFDYLWLIWQFSANPHAATSPVVRPPRLGGNRSVGVFASRSPFRPNPIGLSAVRLQSVEWESEQGPVLHILGADLMDGTPIYDIKPYVVYADSYPEARSGFVDSNEWTSLQVIFPEPMRNKIPDNLLQPLIETLALDPRPAYQKDPQKVYGMPFGGYDVRFTVDGENLTVVDIVSL
ncbi:MAG: tRNA (N6-threonylcarbamoyladenosine(37)-N6)-methyltransferase TrmO [Prevotella sp.]|nr:tRNA (N6-threonylcarbamoyladenosine(37)-N6)-methyltransferase TrmO [Prevotella sp.]